MSVSLTASPLALSVRLSGSALVSTDVVAVRPARLILEWVTVYGGGGKLSLLCSHRLSLLRPWNGEMSLSASMLNSNNNKWRWWM